MPYLCHNYGILRHFCKKIVCPDPVWKPPSNKVSQRLFSTASQQFGPSSNNNNNNKKKKKKNTNNNNNSNNNNNNNNNKDTNHDTNTNRRVGGGGEPEPCDTPREFAKGGFAKGGLAIYESLLVSLNEY